MSTQQVHYQERPQEGLAEYFVWIFIALLVSTQFFFDQLTTETPFRELAIEHGEKLGFSLLVLVLPVAFWQVLGKMPFAYLYVSLQRQKERSGVGGPLGRGVDADGSAMELVRSLARESGQRADGIYQRAGAYLLAGISIAILGVAFFYFELGRQGSVSGTEWLIASLAPRAGVLFFVELVAFFFLRQSRVMMAEYTYYEALQRRREELLVILKILAEEKKEVDVGELLAEGHFYSTAGGLKEGESTELLESRKLEKDELAVLNQVVAAIGKRG